MRYQGYTSDHDPVTGEAVPESSAYVEIDRANPAFFVDCSDLPSLTRQEFAEECDINNLIASFEKTGIFPGSLNPAEPRYLDVSDVPDLAHAHRILNEATESFMALPATVRRDFDNDPIKFIAFAENPDNIKKMREWNLAPPEKLPDPPQRVEIINPAPPPEPKKDL